MALVLDPEAAVWDVRPAGSLTGRVGDFGLGLTNPSGDARGGAGFFSVGFLSAGGVVGRRDAVSVGLPAGLGRDTDLGALAGCGFVVFWAVSAVGLLVFGAVSAAGLVVLWAVSAAGLIGV